MDFATPWTAVCQGSLSFTISWSLLKLKSIELMMPSNHLILYHPLLLLPSISHSIRVFSNELVVRIRWPKYWSFRMGPSNDYSGFVSFRIDWSPCCPKDSQESSPALQLGSINSLAISLLYGPTRTSLCDYRKNHSLNYMDFCQPRVVPLLFNMLFRFVIAFLPKGKHLLIS